MEPRCAQQTQTMELADQGAASEGEQRVFEPRVARSVAHDLTGTRQVPQFSAVAGTPERRLFDESVHADIDREEHAANAIRLREALTTGSVLWPLFFGTDVLMHAYAYPNSPLAWHTALRGVVWIMLISAPYWLRRAPLPSPRMLIAIDALVFGAAAWCVSWMCLGLGGFASPYAAGVPVIMIGRGAFVAMPWRLSLLPGAFTALAFPLTSLAATLWNRSAAQQLRDPAALSIFLLYNLLIFCTFALTLAGGHTVWALRRQVFRARSIDRYRLVRRIGRGGMGEVWVARHATLRREVALKILRSDRLSDPVSLKRFELEVQATIELTHPNTVRVFDYGVTDDGLWYYAMELLAGEDLASLVGRVGYLAPARSVRLMLQLCGALAEAHARGIVHRDLKPENVFVCAAGTDSEFTKVLDFGIAKRTRAAPEQALTQAERVLGTPAYMSPEVALGQAADARSDVYALGALFYFLLTGTAPFESLMGTALLIAHALEAPVSPSARRGTAVPVELENIVLRCLAKAPADRYADAAELQAALARIRLRPEIELVALAART